MKYERHYEDASILFPWMPGKIHRLPELPRLKFKKDKVEYEVTNVYEATDVQWLNECAVLCLEQILLTAADEPDATECNIEISKDFDNSDNKIDLIADIVMAMEWSYSCENGNCGAGSFVEAFGADARDDGSYVLRFRIPKETANGIYQYFRSIEYKPESFCLTDLVIALADFWLDRAAKEKS